MYYFCTYFDHHYLTRGLALYRSLEKYCPYFCLFILCLSKECYDLLSQWNLGNIHLISIDDFEKDNFELLQAKQNRSLVEYYFTCTPSLLLYIFKHYPEVDIITYLDGDLYFFADPKSIFDEIKNNSIAIVAHRFPRHLRHKEVYGKFNVGWLSFRRDKNALSCIKWYQKKCIEWCYDRVEEDRFSDQKYLDFFSKKFKGVIELQHKGANLAPWNIENYKLTMDGNKIYVDNQRLIFFHFHGFKHLFGCLYDTAFSSYKAKFTQFIRENIYVSYLNMLVQCENEAQKKIGNITTNRIGGNGRSRYRLFEKISPKSLNLLRKAKRAMKSLLTGTYMLYSKH